MKNANAYALFSWFTSSVRLRSCGFLLIILWMTSCSTRKVESSTVKKENEAERLEVERKDLEVKENSNVKVTKDVTETEDTTTEKKTYSPVDPTKPSSFTDDNGSKKELNNASYTEEKTTSKKNKKGTTKADLSQSKTTKDKGLKSNGTRAKSKEAVKGKNASRTYFSWWWLLLLLIPIGIYVFRRWRDKIWWV
ncbi:hypothetical protein [Flavobacterium sp.]|uniref:hypothetical protein n=1 Tax=Flavobacterium sp. TaxID=239 RepID=UPI0037BE6982